MSRKRTEREQAAAKAAARAEVIAAREQKRREERAHQAASARVLAVDEEEHPLESDALAREWVIPAPCNGETSGPEFVALVMRCFNPHDCSSHAILDFIAACNRLGMTSEQVCKASWIRSDHLSPEAKAAERARQNIGKSAESSFGPFNPHPDHQEGHNKPELR